MPEGRHYLDGRPVYAPQQLQALGHGLDGVAVARFPRGVPEAAQGVGSLRALHPVHRLAQVLRQRVADLGVLPAPGLHAEQVQLGKRIVARGRGLPVRPRMRAYERSSLVVDVDVEGPASHDHVPSGERRVGCVAVVTLKADVAVLVAPHAREAHGCEPLFGQLQQGEGVLHEQGTLAFPLRVVAFAGPSHARVEEARVVAPDVVDARRRHEQVSPRRADLVLDGPLLVPRARVAERVLEPEMAGEAAEQLGGFDLVADAPADARGVVEHEPGRDAADVGEDVDQTLAHALGVLAAEDLGEPHVGEREVDDEVVEALLSAVDDEIRFSEVDLGLSRRPDKLQKLVFRLSALLAAPLHVELDGRVPDFGAMLLDQALVDALRGVALLAPVPLVLVEIALDGIFVRIEDGGALPGDRQGRGEVPHGQVLPDGGDRHPLVFCDLGESLAFGPPASYTLNGRHV